MTNREKYLDEILAAMPWGKFNNEFDYCENHECDECDFDTGQRSCRKEAMVWLQAEAIEDLEVDWSQVPVDTPIYVKDYRDENWWPRHFAKFEDGAVYAWIDGMTSWSADGEAISWNYTKLVEGDKWRPLLSAGTS